MRKLITALLVGAIPLFGPRGSLAQVRCNPGIDPVGSCRGPEATDNTLYQQLAVSPLGANIQQDFSGRRFGYVGPIAGYVLAQASNATYITLNGIVKEIYVYLSGGGGQTFAGSETANDNFWKYDWPKCLDAESNAIDKLTRLFGRAPVSDSGNVADGEFNSRYDLTKDGFRQIGSHYSITFVPRRVYEYGKVGRATITYYVGFSRSRLGAGRAVVIDCSSWLWIR